MESIKALWRAFARHELVVHKPTGQVLFVHSMLEYPGGVWKIQLWSEWWQDTVLVVDVADVEPISHYVEDAPIFDKEVVA